MTLPRVVFAGTPAFAVSTLAGLLAAGYPVAAVYTQPDRPAGRGRRVQASPVKVHAESCLLTVMQPESLRDATAQAELAALRPDVLVIVAYGLILPVAVLQIPKSGCINVHASLLPRWRGAAPIQRALLAGDRDTGISIMQMAAGLDTGPVFRRARCPIGANETAAELHDKLAQLGASTLLDCLPGIIAGTLAAEPQDDNRANYAAKLTKAEAELDWTRSAEELHRAVLAYNPWPVAHTFAGADRLRVWRAEVFDPPADGGSSTPAPGTVVAESADGIIVATGTGCLRLTELQAAGKNPQTAADFLNARSLVGVTLGAGVLPGTEGS